MAHWSFHLLLRRLLTALRQASRRVPSGRMTSTLCLPLPLPLLLLPRRLTQRLMQLRPPHQLQPPLLLQWQPPPWTLAYCCFWRRVQLQPPRQRPSIPITQPR